MKGKVSLQAKAGHGIVLDHVQTVNKSRLGNLITTLDEPQMESIHFALLFALGF